jgi:hypothetical protein
MSKEIINKRSHNMKQFIKLGVVGLMCGVVSAHAAHLDATVCPTVDQIKKFNVYVASPNSFDYKSQRFYFNVNLNEPNNYGAAGWYFDIDGMLAENGDNLYEKALAMVDNLVPVSVTPYKHTGFIQDREVEDILCAYTVPGHEEITAQASYYPGYNGVHVNRAQVKPSRHQLLINSRVK